MLCAFQFQRRILKFAFFVPMFRIVTPPPPGRGQFLHQGHHTKLVEVHKEMLHTKYLSSKFAFFVSMFQLVTPGMVSVLTPGSHEQDGHDGPGVAHLSLPDCGYKI